MTRSSARSENYRIGPFIKPAVQTGVNNMPTSPRLCCDCRWWEAAPASWSKLHTYTTGELDRCSSPSRENALRRQGEDSLSLVQGYSKSPPAGYCDNERKKDWACGPGGANWEPQPRPPRSEGFVLPHPVKQGYPWPLMTVLAFGLLCLCLLALLAPR